MKKILLLTDFSDNAIHAAKAAVMIAGKWNADLLLYHNYQSLPVTPNYIGGAFVAEEAEWLVDETRESLQKFSGILEVAIEKLPANERKPHIITESGEGDMADRLHELISKNNIRLVVMGSQTGNTIEHFFLGSITSIVVKHTTCPVLVVPQHFDFNNLKHVIFATDFEQTDMDAVQFLISLGKIFCFDLDIVHVDEYEDLTSSCSEKAIDFRKQVSILDYPSVSYKTIRGLDIIRRLKKMCSESGAEVLAIVNREHSFFINLLKKDITKKVLIDQTVPVMIFPAVKAK